jgi:hypothetical protein
MTSYGHNKNRKGVHGGRPDMLAAARLFILLSKGAHYESHTHETDNSSAEFMWPVFLVRANLVFVGIRYKHLEYMTSKASPHILVTLLQAHPPWAVLAITISDNFQIIKLMTKLTTPALPQSCFVFSCPQD